MLTLVCTLMLCNPPSVCMCVDVDVWERGESVWCARVCACVCEWRRAHTRRCASFCPRVCTLYVCLQLTDKPKNLRQVQSICPWFEHCTNPPSTWSFQTKPRIHSLTPIKDKENMPEPYFLYLSCESNGKKKKIPLTEFQTLSGPKQSLQGIEWFRTKNVKLPAV